MDKKRMKRLCIVASCVFVLSFTGCNSRIDNQDKINISSTQVTEDQNKKLIVEETNNENTNNEDTMLNQETTSEVTMSSEGSETITIAPAATKEISIYTMNDSTFEVESTLALVPEDSEITPELIVDLVVDSLADRLVEVGIDNVKVENDTVIVSFLSDQPPLVNVGGGVEGTILDAIAQSIVDNIDNAPKVIFRVEGNAYASGHFEFGLNEVYLDGSKTN